MTLRTQITDAMKDAMRAKDDATLGAVRLVMAELKKRDIDARPRGLTDGIPDEEILSMMQSMIKQRRESITMYEKGNRADLVKQESSEITVIERFLPKQMGEAEVKAAIERVIAATGATSIKDMGKVMTEMKKAYAGQIDFASASNTVKTVLAARG
jgi:uncharacterized protein YqeY